MMDDFSEFMRDVWHRLEDVSDPSQIIRVACEGSRGFSETFQDHHNAAEVLMGGWDRLKRVDATQYRKDYVEHIRTLPHYDHMLAQGFFVRWLDQLQRDDNSIHPNVADPTPSFEEQAAELKQFNNTSTSAQIVKINVGPDGLTSSHYGKLCDIAYQDVKQEISGLGGFVTLADTNAEIQNYDPARAEHTHMQILVFRNAAALGLREVTEENSISQLARSGVIDIKDVHLG